MANFAGYKDVPVMRFGSLVETDDPTQLPIGLACVSRNSRYLQETVATRYGMLRAFSTGSNDPITGLGFLNYEGNSSDGGGKGAAANVTVTNGVITAVNVTSGGSGYAFAPVISLSGGGGGAGAILNAVVSSEGKVTAINIVSGGNGYTQAPAVVIGRVPPKKMALIYDQAGRMFVEDPPGSKTLVRLNHDLLAAGCYATAGTAYNNAYIAQSDLRTGIAKPLVLDGNTQTLQQASGKPLGSTWEAGTVYRVGDIVSPSDATATSIYRAEVVNGPSSNNEPAWPGDNQTVLDGGVLWRECTPFIGTTLVPPSMATLARIAGQGALAAGKDVYVILTLVNSLGETDGLTPAPALLINTVANDAVQVTAPVVPSWNAALAAQYQATGYNVYVAFVATGAAAPVATQYVLANANPIALGQNYSITAAPPNTNADAPQGNDAWITQAGNITGGQRWMLVLFDNGRYITGVSDAMPVGMNPVDSGRSLFAAKIPVGPSGTIRRICALTEGGAGKEGPYFYIATDDKVYPVDGVTNAYVAINSTVINDNTTTSRVFTFLDAYLIDETDVTDVFNKAELPPCTDIQFIKSWNRVVYTGAQGFPSGHLISQAGDPETITLSGDQDSELEVAELDGSRTVTVRELHNVVYSFKENSGYPIAPNGSKPSEWDVGEGWEGSGPCGPLALDKFDEFIVYAHTSGFYLMTGQVPQCISDEELPKTWKRLNKAAKHTVWVRIYPDAREIHIGLPLDGATTPNYRVVLSVLNWSQLNQPSVVFSIRMGKLIPNPDGRKWSVEPLSANCAMVMDRDLTVPADARIDHSQFVTAYNAGYAGYSCPDVYHDEDANGQPVGIDWQYNTTYAPNPSMAQLHLGGGVWSARGNGQFNVCGVPSNGKPYGLTNDKRMCMLTANETVFDAIARNPIDEWWGIGFDNGKQVDAWAEVHHANLKVKVAFANRRG